MNFDFAQLLNPFDLVFLLIALVSIFFGIKNGLTKSIFNLIKWIIIFYLIKNCFDILRPFFDQYISNKTISDISIFFFTIITSYILLSFLNRIVIGVIQPRRSGLVDLVFGGVLGAFRGYIIFVLIFFFIINNFSSRILPNFFEEGYFQNSIKYGVDLLNHMPRNLNEIQKLDI